MKELLSIPPEKAKEIVEESRQKKNHPKKHGRQGKVTGK
jgi:hypothetical protein